MKASFEPLLEVLETGFPKTTELIFREGEISQRNPLLEKLKSFKDVKIEVFPELRTQELVAFIENEASLKGLRFTKGPSKRSLPQDEEWRRPTETDPVKLLATSFGSSPDAIANELAKLSLYVQGREVSVDDVDLICGVERQATVWQLIDGVLVDMTPAEVTARESEEEQAVINRQAIIDKQTAKENNRTSGRAKYTLVKNKFSEFIEKKILIEEIKENSSIQIITKAKNQESILEL